MANSNIEGLRKALEFSPENYALRQLLAESLMENNQLDEAEKEWELVVQMTEGELPKIKLAEVYFKRNKYSACNVVIESLIESGTENAKLYILYTKCLIQENALVKAVEAYQNALRIDSSCKNPTIEEKLTLKRETANAENDAGPNLSIQESNNASNSDTILLEKPNISFKDVGGWKKVKKDIDLKIIKPFQFPELYEAYGKKAGGGILLFGPPGCGKTFIAKATAGEIQSNFLNIGLSNILDMYIGNSEKNLSNHFSLARKNKPCVLFIDEVDALGAKRETMANYAGKNVINQFLMELDGIESDNENLLILAASNMPWNIDSAFRRPGRFDQIVFVPPPDEISREAILRLKLKDKPIEDIDFERIAAKTNKYSGADLDRIIQIAIESKLEEAFQKGRAIAINTRDLEMAISKHKPSTMDWFVTAKNYAKFANDSGIYDGVLEYLKNN